MARYKHTNYNQTKMIPLCFADKVLPGTFEHTFTNVDNDLDLSVFEKQYCNDRNGASINLPTLHGLRRIALILASLRRTRHMLPLKRWMP